MREGSEEVMWALSTISEEALSLSRFNDKVVLAVAARRELPIASYDAKLRKQAAKLKLIALPAEL